MSKQYKTFYYHNARDIPGEYFPMPKSVFRLGRPRVKFSCTPI